MGNWPRLPGGRKFKGEDSKRNSHTLVKLYIASQKRYTNNTKLLEQRKLEAWQLLPEWYGLLV